MSAIPLSQEKYCRSSNQEFQEPLHFHIDRNRPKLSPKVVRQTTSPNWTDIESSQAIKCCPHYLSSSPCVWKSWFQQNATYTNGMCSTDPQRSQPKKDLGATFHRWVLFGNFLRPLQSPQNLLRQQVQRESQRQAKRPYSTSTFANKNIFSASQRSQTLVFWRKT